MMIKVSIYEDNAKLRQAMCMLISSQDDLQLMGSYENCVNILQNCQQSMPDIILMDIDMPLVNGIEGLRMIRPKFPLINVLMLTVFEENEKIFEAIQSGASGYLLKNSSLEDIIKAIHTVQEGGAPLSPYVAKKILAYHSMQLNNPKNQLAEKLSDRELEVIQLLADGNSAKMIAERMFLSQNTILTHLKRIYQKLEVHSAIEAIKKFRN
ncbi:MAG: response regulator transcription factor [Saprospiraceae bacterium]|jgi:DNA-binding NarL/FixJ family response regulator